MGKKLEQAISILNGALGDHLARTGNGLATRMTLVQGGVAVAAEPAALARAYPAAGPRAVLLVHGLMSTEHLWDMPGDMPAPGEGADAPAEETAAAARDYGAALAADLGYTPLYLRYNSGRAIADNGADLAALLEQLVDAYPAPLEEILLLGHSMGGLVIRSACHTATERGDRWLARVRRCIYVGTPHLGAPLERLGRGVTRLLRAVPDPYTRMVADIGNLRSSGIKDLGNADLRHGDADLRRRGSSLRRDVTAAAAGALAGAAASVSLRDRRHPVPLLPELEHYLVAGSVSASPFLTACFGDGIVPLGSATDGLAASLGSAALPPSHVAVFPGISHIGLARHPGVYDRIRAWCAAARP
jgi:triacylglycerol lipase